MDKRPEVTWLIDELLIEDKYPSGYPLLRDAVTQAGHRTHITKYVPFSTDIDIPIAENSCVVTHGTVQFCGRVAKKYGRAWTPGLYFNDNVKLFHKFAVHMGEDLLNSEYMILPWAEVVRRNYLGHFVKPLSGLKEFVGQVLADFKDVGYPNPPDLDTLCVVAPPREIKGEFRYVICDRKVITGSEYRWDNVLDVRRDTHPLCDAMARKVAEAEWQADRVYVCDVVLTPSFKGELEAKVIELNAFSSSGLYACDTTKIVEAVSNAAWAEYCGVD